MDQILNDLVKLPKTKRNLRLYNINSSKNIYSVSSKAIQMVSALVMQLIQSAARVPDEEDNIVSYYKFIIYT